ncbi:MAG: DsbA family protein [Saprospiraceae bacterium]|nr:DsbA family protein [Saprospiraceae bacterium]
MTLKPPVSTLDHCFGNPEAAIELVEYGDFQCPYCGRAFPIVKRIQEIFGNDLKFIFRNFPLSKIHPEAKSAAVATEAAGLQGQYWEMHHLIFENQRRLFKNALMEYAGRLNLHTGQFEADLHNPGLIEKVESDFESGLRSGVNATPTFFINGEKYTGAWEGPDLENFLQQELAKSKNI